MRGPAAASQAVADTLDDGGWGEGGRTGRLEPTPQATCTVTLMIAAAPTRAAVVVIRPVTLERVQPLHPRLASRPSDPTEKPMLIRACGSPVLSERNIGGAAG